MHRGSPLAQIVTQQITALTFVSAGHFLGESEAKLDSTLKIRVCMRASPAVSHVPRRRCHAVTFTSTPLSPIFCAWADK